VPLCRVRLKRLKRTYLCKKREQVHLNREVSLKTESVLLNDHVCMKSVHINLPL
ncbi:hypothetical protein ACLOJK_029387, partial [Asimina triloba]